MGVIAAIFALLLIIDGSFKLNTAATARRANIDYWWIILIPSILTIVGSFWMIKYPPESAAAVTVIIGILFIIEAAANIMSAPILNACEHKAQSESANEIIREDTKETDGTADQTSTTASVAPQDETNE